MVREIRGAKINPKSSFKNLGEQNTRRRKLREQIRYIYIYIYILIYEFSQIKIKNSEFQIGKTVLKNSLGLIL